MFKILLILICYLFLGCRGYDLVVYSVDTLFSYPSYNFTRAFELFAGLPEGSVLLVPVADGQLEDSITQPLVNPTPDVVIGIDNIHQYGIDKNTFSPVNPSELSSMDPHLAAQLSEYNLFPYEYGRVTLIGNKTRIGSKFDPATLSLHSLVSNPDILRGLVVQDPTTSATGAAFMLSTIATFGDARNGVAGVVMGSDWRDWWTTVLKYSTVVSSWSETWNLFANDPNYTLIVSYELDQTYYTCNNGATDIVALELQNKMWYLVEGIGVHNRSKNSAVALQFVNWFLSDQIQQLIPDHEWMFPARSNVALPPCFKGYIPPNPEFNEVLNSTTLKQNIAYWYREWLQIKNTSINPSSSSTTSCYLPLTLTVLLLCIIF